MTRRTRYFMAGSAAVVVAGLGVGLAAYYSGGFMALSASTGPTELAYVPADATVVAYADVRSIMDSELRQRLKATLPMPEQGQQEFRAATGIDIERDIDYIVAAGTPGATTNITGLVVARGRFDTVKLEGLAREHGAEMQDYKGKRLLVLDAAAVHGGTTETTQTDATQTTHKGVLAFLEPGLVAIGELSGVQRAIDAQLTAQSITSNNEMMELVSDIERANNAWAVGRFDVLARQAQLPEQISRQIPPVKWFAAAGHINGGVSGSLRAEALDEKSAEQLRAVLNGFVALVQMQGQNDPKLSALAQSLAVTGSGQTVSLTFTLPAEILELMAPKQPAIQ
jgi:hypothetical protein